MLLVADVGNTNTKIGVFDRDRLLVSWVLTSRREQTDDEYGVAPYRQCPSRQREPGGRHTAWVACCKYGVAPYRQCPSRHRRPPLERRFATPPGFPPASDHARGRRSATSAGLRFPLRGRGLRRPPRLSRSRTWPGAQGPPGAGPGSRPGGSSRGRRPTSDPGAPAPPTGGLRRRPCGPRRPRRRARMRSSAWTRRRKSGRSAPA